MLVTEYYMTTGDGVVLNRTYSDAGYYIERDGVMYEEAIDPENSGRVYTETDEPYPVEEQNPEEIQEILSILLGEEP